GRGGVECFWEIKCSVEFNLVSQRNSHGPAYVVISSSWRGGSRFRARLWRRTFRWVCLGEHRSEDRRRHHTENRERAIESRWLEHQSIEAKADPLNKTAGGPSRGLALCRGSFY